MSYFRYLTRKLFISSFLVFLSVIIGFSHTNAQTRVIDRSSAPFKRRPSLEKARTSQQLRDVRQGHSSKQSSRVVSQSQSASKNLTHTASDSSTEIEDYHEHEEVIEPSEGRNYDKIAINFESVDLMSLVRYLSQETGRGFIINRPLQGDVTIISPITVSKKEALAMLESILQARGYTAIESGRMFRIVSLSDARVAGTQTRTHEDIYDLSDDDTLVTQIVPLMRTSVDEADRILQNLLPGDTSMLLFPPSNTIVITGRSINIKRALEVLSELESGMQKPELDIVPLRFSSAEDVKEQLEQIISNIGVERDKLRGGVTFIADRRNNSLLVLSSKDNFERIRQLISRLDISATDSRPEITEFFSLRYANEEETVRQLEDILGLGDRERAYSDSDPATIETTRLVPISRTRSIMVTTRSETIITRIRQLLEHLDMPPETDVSDVRVVRVVNAEARVLAETLTRLVQQRNQGKQDNDSVSFVAEEHTNSIIMTGPPQQFSHYLNIIDSLDLMRPQILVEVLITEVSGQLTHSLGIEWNTFDFGSSGEQIYGGTNYGLRSGPLSGSGFQLGLFKGDPDPVELARGNMSQMSNIRAMVKAYRNNSDFNILSAPQILTTDNEEARISVGEVVALPQGFTQDRDTGRFDLTNFKYEDVGIVLSLTPRVNSDELVTLKISQEIKKRQEENLYAFNVPVLTKREMNTTITVPDRRTIVIGGLISEDETRVVESVPLLSRLPLIGDVFKNRRRVTQKTNLLVFITPHILSTPQEVADFDIGRTSSHPEQVTHKKEKSSKLLEDRQKHMRSRATEAFDKILGRNQTD